MVCGVQMELKKATHEFESKIAEAIVTGQLPPPEKLETLGLRASSPLRKLRLGLGVESEVSKSSWTADATKQRLAAMG